MIHLLSTAGRADAVTPNDSTDLSGGGTSAGLYIGGGGSVSCDVGGKTLSFLGLPAGAVLPVVATRVRSTGTTATGIVALYGQ